jgi:hypothetical protein
VPELVRVGRHNLDVTLSYVVGNHHHCKSASADRWLPGRLTRAARPRYDLCVRRLLLFSVLGAVAVLPPSLQAQRGFAARAPVRVAPRMAAPPARMMPAPRGIPAAGVRFVPPGRLGHPFFVNPRFRHHHHLFITSNPCFANPSFCQGFFFPNQVLSYPPLFWPETGYAQQPYPVAQQTYDDTALRNQIDRLADEVERLREEQEAHRAPQPVPRSSLEQAPTVLVFRDGHRSEVQNYGIVGQTLWVFTERHARKYPLTDLDLQATKSANEQRGVEFALPSR